MAKVKAKQIDQNGLVSDAMVRTSIPSGVVLTIPDGRQYVVHTSSFPIIGDVLIEGDGELRVYE